MQYRKSVRLASFLVIAILLPINVYFGVSLPENLHYISTLDNGAICGKLQNLDFLGWLLPVLFTVLGLSALIQLIFSRALTYSFAFLCLNLTQQALLASLLVAGNSYCAGASVGHAVQALFGPLYLGALFAILPIPIMLYQIH